MKSSSILFFSKISILFFFTCIVFSAKAQNFPESNAKWIFNYIDVCWGYGVTNDNYSIEITGDTTINSTTYHKLYTTHVQSILHEDCYTKSTGYEGAFRQDGANKKVYFIEPLSSTEELLYDFNLEVGDPIVGRLEKQFDEPETVVSIDYVYVGSEYRKRWNINTCYNFSIIEGVGSTYGLLYHSVGCVTDLPSYFLTCFKENTNLYPNTLEDCDFTTAIKSKTDELSNVNIYPNPSKGSITIDFQTSNIVEVQLSDLLGNVLWVKNTTGQTKIAVDNLDKSIYILMLRDNNNNERTRKIINCP